MKLIYNMHEYKTWILNVCFKETGNTSDNLIDEIDIDGFITQHHPEDYPCVCLVTPGPVFVSSYSILFIYRSQINEWARRIQERQI